MTSPLPSNTSGTARLFAGAPGYAVGWQERVIVPSPAVGAQWSYTVDGRWFERLVMARYTFATSAAAGNRFLAVQLTDTNGLVVTKTQAGENVAPSNSVNPWLTIGTPIAAQGPSGDTFGYLPDVIVPPGWVWGSQVFGMDVADAFTGIVLVVQRFPSDTVAISASG